MTTRWRLALGLTVPLVGGSCKHKDEVEMQSSNTQSAAGAPAAAPASLRTRAPSAAWHAAVRGTVLAAPAGAGGLVVVATVAPGNTADAGAVQAFEARTGAPRWTFDAAAGLQGGVAHAPVVAGDLVLFGTSAGVVYALDLATGAERWRATLGNGPLAGVTVAGDEVLAAGEGIALHALDRRTGAARWEAAAGTGSYAAAAADGTDLFIGAEDGTIHALAAGKPRWKVTLPASMPVHLALTSDLVLVALLADRSLHALDRATGAERWTYAMTSAAGVAPRAPVPVLAGTVAIVGDGDQLLGLTLATGATAWTTRTTGDTAAALALPDLALATSRDGMLVAADPASGTLLWSLRVAEPITSGLLHADGFLFAADAAGQLTAYAP